MLPKTVETRAAETEAVDTKVAENVGKMNRQMSVMR